MNYVKNVFSFVLKNIVLKKKQYKNTVKKFLLHYVHCIILVSYYNSNFFVITLL